MPKMFGILSTSHIDTFSFNHQEDSLSTYEHLPSVPLMDVDNLSSRLATPFSQRSIGASGRSRGSSLASHPFSAREPPAGASKEHEQVHRQFHDDAAGERISWWLRQRDKSNDYTKCRGLLVGGPSVFPGEERNPTADQMAKAFAGAAGRRASSTRQAMPYTADSAMLKLQQRGKAGRSTGRGVPWSTLSVPETLTEPEPTPSRNTHGSGVAAGKKSMGAKARTEGIKVHPSGQVSEIEQLISGHDISTSPGKLQEHLSRPEFNGAAGKKSLGEVVRPGGLKTNVSHAVSQVDELVFGRDMDLSVSRTEQHLEDATFHGAAGRRYVGYVERSGGVKPLPARTISHADAVILGRDLGHSEDKMKEQRHLEAFRGAAGSQNLGHEPRKEGLKNNFMTGASQVDEIVFGNDTDLHDHLRPGEFVGRAGRKYIGHQEHPGGLRTSHMAHVSTVDKIAFGASDESRSLDAHLQSPAWEGAAGRKCVGAPAKQEGRQAVLGSGLSEVDEVVWGHDIDGSREKLRQKEQARLKAIGCT